jgi:hypothetical protein
MGLPARSGYAFVPLVEMCGVPCQKFMPTKKLTRTVDVPLTATISKLNKAACPLIRQLGGWFCPPDGGSTKCPLVAVGVPDTLNLIAFPSTDRKAPVALV